MRNALLSMIFPSLLLACSTGRGEDLAALNQKAALGQTMARYCFHDSLYVPVQHSGNCLAAVRFLRDDSIDRACAGDTGIHCRALNEKVLDAYAGYWRAVVNTLWVYGKPNEFDLKDEGYSGIVQFYDIHLMEESLENCFAKETAIPVKPLSAVDPATVDDMALNVRTVRNPLHPGQKCIREGYAEPSPTGSA